MDFIWQDGQLKSPDLEVALDRPDDPVRVRFVEDDRVVKEYVAGSLAEARAQMTDDMRTRWRDVASRSEVSPETKAFAELMGDLPTESSIMQMTDDQRRRMLAAVKPLLAAGRLDMTAEEQARVVSEVREAVNAVMSEVAK